MACLTTEKSRPLTQQKRSSLPGPMGGLNLYAAHQQRRLSERGLMIYRPNKPDIDLIRDFTNPSKRNTSSFLLDRDPSGSHQQRRHSTIVNVMANSSSSGMSSPSTSSAPWPVNYTTERRHSSIIPGSANLHMSTNSNSSGVYFPGVGSSGAGSSVTFGPSPSTSRHPYHPSKLTAPNSSTSSSSGGNFNSNSPGFSNQSIGNSSFASNNNGNSGQTTSCLKGMSDSGPSATTSGCRKVRLRIQKNPGAKEKVFELTPITGSGTISSTTVTSSPGDLSDEDDKLNFLRHPQYDNRRYSDSAAIHHTPNICITPYESSGRRSVGAIFNKDSGIVCTTGDLLTLKCLTSSAQEIRCTSSGSEGNSSSAASNDSTEQSQTLGNRSRSFDATIIMARKGPGSSWFSRRHQPIAVKLPLPINSPTISSPGDTRYFPSSAVGFIRTPILTITNENASKSELIEIPSPPAASPVSSRSSPEEKSKVAWDKNGFVLDAAVLGIAIENHLRKVDMKRRATFSALYQPQPVYLESKVHQTRARSASACVFPIPLSVTGSNSEAGSSSGSICSGSKSTSCRKSSLTSTSITGGKPFFWERGGSSSSSGGGVGGSVTTPTMTSTAAATATTSVSLTGGGSSSGHQTYETHVHRLHMSLGMSSSAYMNNTESPSSDSYINFRATEDDIEEENLGAEDDEDDNDDDEEAEEKQAFLQHHHPRQTDQQPRVDRKNSQSGTRSTASTSSGQPNEGNQHSSRSGSNNPNRGNSMSICSAIRDFILQSIRS